MEDVGFADQAKRNFKEFTLFGTRFSRSIEKSIITEITHPCCCLFSFALGIHKSLSVKKLQEVATGIASLRSILCVRVVHFHRGAIS